MGHVGRHRRGTVPLRLVVAAALYVAAWATFSAYATWAVAQ
jgi:hypothetical protein